MAPDQYVTLRTSLLVNQVENNMARVKYWCQMAQTNVAALGTELAVDGATCICSNHMEWNVEDL